MTEPFNVGDQLTLNGTPIKITGVNSSKGELVLDVDVEVTKPVEVITVKAVINRKGSNMGHNVSNDSDIEDVMRDADLAAAASAGATDPAGVLYAARTLLANYEYPSDQIAEFGGIPLDVSYDYVSDQFLYGLINYGKNHRAYLMCRYGLNNEHQTGVSDADYVPTEDEYKKFIDNKILSRNSRLDGDDWLVMYETPNSFIFMWFDRDVSDCSVERWDKDTCAKLGINTIEDFEASRIQWHNVTSDNLRRRDNWPKILLKMEMRNPWFSP